MEIGLSQVSVIQRWDRPSFFVVCQVFARPQQPDRRQKTIVCPTWFPAPIPHQLGQPIFLNAWKLFHDLRSSETRLVSTPVLQKENPAIGCGSAALWGRPAAASQAAPSHRISKGDSEGSPVRTLLLV